MNELILMAHVIFGVGCMLAAVWVFVDVLNSNPENLQRIRLISRGAAGLMWLAFVVGGYWYVTSYPADKAVIIKGPWPFAHKLVMETKEHLVIILLMLATYLPIVACEDFTANKDARKLMLWVSAMIAVLALGMDGEGAMIAMGVKVGLLGR